MTMETVIKVKNLSKKFRRFSSAGDAMKEFIHPFRKRYHNEFWALKDVSIEIKRGECIGIIGRNGSGKSTLLQILCGIMPPTSGELAVNGRIAALLELGAGFHPQFSGRDNVYLSGALMGFTKEDMEEKFQSIADFADIGDFIDQPVTMYSSGMFVRLAFSVAIHVDPEILIIDEALAVGDMRFQQKCYRKINEFKEKGNTIILITHDMAAVKNFCSTAAWLNDGKISMTGPPVEIIKSYTSYMNYDLQTTLPSGGGEGAVKKGSGIEWEDVSGCPSFGEGGAVIKGVALYAKDPYRKIKAFGGGEWVVFYAEIEAAQEISSPIVGLAMNNSYGQSILGIGNWMVGADMGPLAKGDTIIAEFEMKLPLLKNGQYSFTVSIADGTEATHAQLHWVHDAYVLEIINNNPQTNMFYFAFREGDVNVKIKKAN